TTSAVDADRSVYLRRMMTNIHDLLVIGAGPYGLSIGAHATAAGLNVCVVGRPMASWRYHMPKGMLLKSEPWASDLSDPTGLHSLAAYSASRGLIAEHGHPTPLSVFNEYGLWFARRVVPPVEERTVIEVVPEGAGFSVTTAGGKAFRARTVAVAVGMLAFMHLPRALGELPPELYSHSSDHHDLGAFDGQDVTVIGAGQAALETATLLAEQGASPRVVARTESLVWNTPPQPLQRPLLRSLRDPHSGLGTGWANWLWSRHPGTVRRLPAARRTRIAASALGPAGSWWLRGRFNERNIPFLTGHRVQRAEEVDGRVRLTLADFRGTTTTQYAGHVIAATGFSADVHKLGLLDSRLRSTLALVPGSASPELNRGFESSHRGLFFAGLLAVPSFGPSMRFVHGTNFTAQRLVKGVCRTLRSS
ncbi:NAD(P)-binding domain-containing protein, partial [Streptomyces goshikiensis]